MTQGWPEAESSDSKSVAEASRLRPTPYQFYQPESETTRIQGAYLPHWTQERTLYFVTFRLADSLPQEKLHLYREEKKRWLQQNSEPLSLEQQAEYYQRFPQRLEKWLDAGYGSMILLDADAKTVVENALRHFADERYILDKFVVVPNHVHVLVAPLEGHSLSDILHSWKSYTAKAILKLPVAAGLGTHPTVWQKESWDHIVRSDTSLQKFRDYIQNHTKRAETFSKKSS